MNTFLLKKEHIILLQHAYIGWQDCETGAPEINPKRPYGNSYVLGDIARILSEPVPDVEENYETYQDWRMKRGEQLMILHQETETALQVILATGSFEPGLYALTEPYNSRSWKRVESEKTQKICERDKEPSPANREDLFYIPKPERLLTWGDLVVYLQQLSPASLQEPVRAFDEHSGYFLGFLRLLPANEFNKTAPSAPCFDPASRLIWEKPVAWFGRSLPGRNKRNGTL